MRHDERYEELDTLSDVELVDSSQDIRGLPLVSPEGEQFGIIKDMLVDRERNRVSAIRLEDGRVTSVEPLQIHDNAVVYGEAAVAHYDEAASERTAAGAGVIEEEVIPVIEERVVIGKRVAEHGREINVHTRVVSETVGEDVHLRDEKVSVEKRSVERKVSAQDAEAMLAGKTVTMTEHDEEVVVAKDAMVTDEVVVRKTAGDKVQHVEETVRKTVVDVDQDKQTRRR